DIFRSEFDDVLSVVAQEIDIKITVREGIRPIRVLGSEAEINGQVIETRIAQIYSGQDRHVVMELEMPAEEAGKSRQVASVQVKYENMTSHERESLECASG